ncbi:MAG: hypothetical protein ACLFUO_05980, partial [Candidatus Woesearchaeota archaeon]
MKKFLLFILFIFIFLDISSAEQIDLPKDEDGWTIFSPSSDTRIVYVSNDGNDSTGQIYSETDFSDPFNPSGEQAFATYAAAFENTRDGYPDWILMRRGDVFYETVNSNVKSGRDSDEPFLIGSYGNSGLGPVFKTGTEPAIRPSDTTRWFAFSGIDFYAHTRNPDDPEYVDSSGSLGIDVLTGSGESIEGVLFEGCKFRFYQNNRFQLWNGDEITGIKLSRCIFSDNYIESGHCQGLYTNLVDGIILEENLFIHNGWLVQSTNGDNDPAGGQATMFNHNTYFASSTNVDFHENVFIEGSSANNKFTAQYNISNINIQNNLYIGAENALSMGANYENLQRIKSVNITENIVTDVGRSRPTNRYLSWGFWLQGFKDGIVDENYILNQKDPSNTNTVGINIDGDHRNVSFNNNVIYGLMDGVGFSITSDDFQDITISDNKIQLLQDSDYIISSRESTSGNCEFSDNTYFSDRSDESRFSYMFSDTSFDDWRTSTGDNSSFEEYDFPDPARSIETYQESLGKEASIDAFIDSARMQDRYNWSYEYTATVVNAWIKEGFAVSEESQEPESGEQEKDILSPTINLIYPEDNMTLLNESLNFSVFVSDNNTINNVSLFGNWTGWHLNETNTSGVDGFYLFSKNLTNGSYYWNIYACDNNSNCAFALQNQSFVVELISYHDADTNQNGIIDLTELNSYV